MASDFSLSLLLASTVIRLLIALVLTAFWLDAAVVVALLRNSRIDGDLSMRFRVCSKIGPSFEQFLFNLCWNMIDPSEMLVVPDVFDVWIECRTALPFPPFKVAAVAASAIWLAVMVVEFFNVDWITNLFDSCVSFGVVDILVSDAAFLCKRIDGEFDVLLVRLSSSLLAATLTAPLFNKLNKSCPFCKMICPFSVRAPRIKIMLLGWCDCYVEKINCSSFLKPTNLLARRKNTRVFRPCSWQHLFSRFPRSKWKLLNYCL